MKRNPVGWFEIYVQDMARAKAFYEGVFQTRLERLNSPQIEMWMFPADMEAPGSGGSLVSNPGVRPGGNSTVIYFSCRDCAEEEARIPGLGGRIHRPKISIGEYGFVTLAFDTEGNLFGLHSLE